MRRLLFLLGTLLIAVGANAQEIKTPSEAFKAGQDFANGRCHGPSCKYKGTSTSVESISSKSGSDNVPKYNTNAPESGAFGGGKGSVGGVGVNKQVDCRTAKAPSAYAQQECDAVNYLNKMDRKNVFSIDKKNDPIIKESKKVINDPGAAPAGQTSACRIVETPVPGTYTTETCEETSTVSTAACTRTLVPSCGLVGAEIKSHDEYRGGAFTRSSFTWSGVPGLYNYTLEVPYRACSAEGLGEISFNLDTSGRGSYITLNVSELDDALAIAVNGSTVFAGYPNSGPYYSNGFFPDSRRDFQFGYSWVEDGATFSAGVKLLDYCPAGYQPTSQATYACDSSGDCNVPSSSSADNVMGFFCNAEGKFLMNRHEGSNNWAGTVQSTVALQEGMNRITTYWGTALYRRACGNVRVWGQIYNVAPGCSASWDDQCADMRNAVKQ
jgi:hypothetical protein